MGFISCSVKAKQVCERTLLNNSNLKTKEDSKQVGNKVVEKFKAMLGYTTIPKLSSSHSALLILSRRV